MARKLDSRDEQQPPVKKRGEPASPGDGDAVLDRRTVIKSGVTALWALSTEPVTGSPTASVSRHGIEFRSSRDAIDDLGMDPTGEEPIDGELGETVDGDLIQFPDGTYRIDGGPETTIRNGTRGFEGVGENVTFRPSEGATGYLLDASEIDGVYVSNLSFDQRSKNSCIGLRLTGNRVICEDIRVVGDCDRPAGGVPLIAHATESATEHSLVEGVVSSGGCTGRPVLGRPGIFLEQSHRGTLTVRDCDLRQFPNAAVDATRHSGRIRVLDSHFQNNAAAIRLSRPGSRIERVKIVVDGVPAPVESSTAPSPFRLHGIAVGGAADGSVSDAPVAVSNSTMRIEDVRSALPAVVSSASGTSVRVEDCEVVYNNDGESVVAARAPGSQRERSVGSLHLRDSVLRGSGTVSSIVVATNADGTTVANSALELSGGDGISISASDRCTIEQTTVSVPGHAGVFRASSVTAAAVCSGRPQESESWSGPQSPGVDQVTIDSVDPPTWYEFTVDGRLDSNSVTSAARAVSGENAEGVVGSAPVTYAVDGKITDLRLGDGGRVYLNGHGVDEDTLGRGYPHRLCFDGRDTDTAYAFSANTLSPKTPRTGEKNQVNVAGTETLDTSRFAGALEALSLVGTATLSFSQFDHSAY